MLRIFKLLKPKYKFLSFCTSLLTIVHVFAFLILPNFFGLIISLVGRINDNSPIKFEILKITFNFVNVKQSLNWIIVSFIVILLIALASALGASYLGNFVSAAGARDIRLYLWEHIEKLSQKDLELFTNAKIMTRFTIDIQRIQTGIISTLRMLIIGPTNLIVGLILGLLTNLKLSISFAIMVPLIIITISIAAILLNKKFKLEQKNNEEINVQSQENVLGIKVIKSYNLESLQENKFENVNLNQINTSKKIWNGFSITFNFVFFAANIASVFILAIVGYSNIGIIKSISQHAQLITDINIFINYISFVTFGIIMTSFTMLNVYRAVISSKKIFEILDISPDIPFIKSDKKITHGSIEFKNVNFKYYSNGEKNVLDNISFKINPGETLGIIGPTGSGKSTIAKLISHDFKIESGEILIDNNNINEIDSNSLNNNISHVYQIPLILSGTIKSNLLFANPNANEDNVIESTKISCAYDYINKFSEKFEHKIEQKGVNLSGGQKQRLSIAQGIIRNPKILILDDSTSALDNKTEKNVIQNIKNRFKKSPISLIIISQKISSIVDADNIIVMHHGHISASGTHEQLMKKSNLYKEIASTQLGDNNA